MSEASSAAVDAAGSVAPAPAVEVAAPAAAAAAAGGAGAPAAAAPASDAGAAGAVPGESPFYGFAVKTVKGEMKTVGDFARGKVAIVANTASQCGFTPQYAGLQTLYDTYGPRGFTVLGFPSREFGAQDFDKDADIETFVCSRFKATFPLMGRVQVNGGDAHPLFKWMKEQPNGGGFLVSAIKWNFTKFLVDAQGQVVQRYAPTTTPEAIAADIEALLKAAGK